MVTDVSLIVFGGINFKNEGSRESFHLEIDMQTLTYTLSYMPDARLRCSDQFMDNQALHVYDELNVVTMIGKRGAYKINLKSPIGKLQWRRYRKNLGYGKRMEVNKLPIHYQEMC